MNVFKTSKSLLACAIMTTLVGCGDDYSPTERTTNSAPTSNGDLTLNMNETDLLKFETVHLLDGVVDTDGDYVRVLNLRTDATDLIGIGNENVNITVNTEEMAPHLDSGQNKVVVYEYDLSDGIDTISRKLTINVAGYDEAPVFDDILLGYAETDGDSITVDLAQGITDADGEEIVLEAISEVANPNNAASVANNVVTINVGAFKDTIKGGDQVVFEYKYQVKDHNHSLERTARININGVSTEPEAPTGLTAYSADISTTDSVMSVDLSVGPYAIDYNGDAITVDYSTITPTNGAPAIKFDKSYGNNLVVDPIDFARHLANVNDTASYTYMYEMRDAGGLASNHTFTLNVTKKAQTGLLTGGGFESASAADDGWAVESIEGVTAESTLDANAWEGDRHFAVTSTGSRVKLTKPFVVESMSSYYVENIGRNVGNEFGGYKVFVTKPDGDNVITEAAYRYANAQAAPEMNAAAFSTGMNDDATRTLTLDLIHNSQIDAVNVYRYSSDAGNNLVANLADGSHDFETGTIGGWSAGEITTDPAEVISGTSSLKVKTGLHTLTLPSGTVKNGKKYLILLDIKVLATATPIPTILTLADKADTTVTVDGATATRAQNYNRHVEERHFAVGEQFKIQQIVDLDAFNTNVTDWAQRDVVIKYNPMHWGNPNSRYAIDNVRVIEVE
ncbi:hypothetical protein [Algibacillus agarilyticus]|uniref:hypothetical protein n=1 Tax=Algibacillus agarilyticus TaxID=2234133 RepID=UPI000DD0E688|nr:hypothetical protein [Algibacillus agarilyticus]